MTHAAGSKTQTAGNMTKVPKPNNWSAHYDPTYGAWNRLVAVDDGATNVVTYEYDGLGRRIEKRVGDDTTPSATYDYYYSTAWQVLEVHEDGDDNFPLEQYVWHAYYIDAPAVRFYDSNTDGQSIAEHYYGHDAQFNVTVVHDKSGNVLERYAYTPYGELTIMEPDWDPIASSTISNPYTFTGREYDKETGLYHFRNRYYHAQLGRFVSRDPIGYADGMNLYAGYFVPNGMDPSGLEGWAPDYLQGEEGLVPDYLQGEEGLVPDFLWGSTSPYGQAVVGLGTGSKAVVNAGGKAIVGTATLGFCEAPNLLEPTDYDLAIGYDWAEGSALVSGEILVGLATGGMAQAGSTVAVVIDAGGNVVGVVQGAADIAENGLTVGNAFQVIAGTAGSVANVAGSRPTAGSPSPNVPPFPIEGSPPGTAFSGAYNPNTGGILMCRSIDGPTVPPGCVPRRRGHLQVSQMLGHEPTNMGFTAFLEEGGTLRCEWLSRSINGPNPMFAGPEVPPSYHPSILQAIQEHTGHLAR